MLSTCNNILPGGIVYRHSNQASLLKRSTEPVQHEQYYITSTQQSYDRVAGLYAEKYLHEFDHKAVDRDLLDRFAERVKERGPVLDLGCGPGQVARYLHDKG